MTKGRYLFVVYCYDMVKDGLDVLDVCHSCLICVSFAGISVQFRPCTAANIKFRYFAVRNVSAYFIFIEYFVKHE